MIKRIKYNKQRKDKMNYRLEISIIKKDYNT